MLISGYCINETDETGEGRTWSVDGYCINETDETGGGRTCSYVLEIKASYITNIFLNLIYFNNKWK